MRFLCASVLVMALVTVASAGAHWRFVVAGDGRADPKAARPEDKNGVNTVITTEIAQAVIAEKAKFLCWTGDLALGDKDAAKFEEQLMTWRGIMQPLYDLKIPVLACRGNHEAGSADSVAVWNKVFSGPYATPNNGPEAEKNLTYYYGKGSVLVLGLDQYLIGKEQMDQAWIDHVFQRFPKPFIFAFGHEPAFMDGSHKDNLDAHPADRDAFWNSLIKVGSRIAFMGHDHLYDHMIVTRDGADPGPEMHQIVAGTAGAPFYKQGDYTGDNTGWKLRRAKHIDSTYGYLVVEINGKRATVTFKGRLSPGRYVPMDSVSYTVN